MRRTFVTHSSKTCSDVDGVVAEESSHSFQAPLQPCFHRVVPCHWARLEELLMLWSQEKRQARASSWAPRTSDGFEEKGGKQIVVNQG